MEYTYAQFKVGPPRQILAALDPVFLAALDKMHSYSDFRQAIASLDDEDHNRFLRAARRYVLACSATERELLKGILLLTAFPHVADQISEGDAYSNMYRCRDDFREAFVACIVNA